MYAKRSTLCQSRHLIIYIRLLGVLLLLLIIIMWKANPKKQSPEDDVIADIRTRHLSRYDPTLTTDYSASRPAWAKYAKSWNQSLSKFIIQQLNFTRNGFFIECRALDGQFLSNSLFLEQKYNWTGLLIEADPQPLKILKKRNRHAWVAGVCLSPKPYPVTVKMKGHADVIGHGYIDNEIVSAPRNKMQDKYNRHFVAECYPLDMLVRAVRGVNAPIDYLSLDVEGVELDILKTIPFNLIPIKVISVEVRPENKKSIQSYLQSVGYRKILEVVLPNEFVHDDVYMSFS